MMKEIKETDEKLKVISIFEIDYVLLLFTHITVAYCTFFLVTIEFKRFEFMLHRLQRMRINRIHNIFGNCNEYFWQNVTESLFRWNSICIGALIYIYLSGIMGVTRDVPLDYIVKIHRWIPFFIMIEKS